MDRRPPTRLLRSARLPVLGLVVLALVLAACGGGSDDSSSGNGTKPAATGAPENPALYYLPIRNQADLQKLGPVNLIVAGAGNARRGGADIAKMIHATGAKAYIYQQTYWFPQNRGHQGLNISRHPDWQFCANGNQPLVATRNGEQWVFLDMNESRVQQFLSSQFKEYKAAGWDGVFFDRGGVALGALDQDPPVWHVQSTCTEKPVRPGATFSDTWVDVAGLVRQAGLSEIVNYGLSPFDPSAPMRKDPRNQNCVDDKEPCPTLDDAWKDATYVLDEAPAHPRDVNWATDFTANSANENDPQHPNRVIGLITVGTLGGDLSRQNVFFEWARVKLFDMPLAIAVWDRGTACADAEPGDGCRGLVTYPELSSIRLGTPIDKKPQSSECAASGPPNCVWSRRYEGGASVVNVSDRTVQGYTLKLGTDGCRYVYDVWTGATLSANKCVDQVSLDLGPWSGRPLSYSTAKR